ncbi:hypothetical protein [Roseateles sp.]|uniref:hypothetical protein n=1 Tax=Roseateles sp. TaxID=1971397 RepID=UPI003263AC32
MKKTLQAIAMVTAVTSASAPALAADTQFAVLVLAMPTKYHYEYIPVARESFEKLAKLHAFEMYKDPRYLDHLWGGIWWAATGH